MSRRVRLTVQDAGPVSMGLTVASGDPIPMSLGVGGRVVPARDYNDLTNKPSIEGHTLIGDSKLPEIGVHDITPQQIDNIIFG